MPQSGLWRKMARVSDRCEAVAEIRDGFARHARSSDPPARWRDLEDRADNPVMDPAAAQIAGKSHPDLGLTRLLDAVEQRFGKHDDAGNAVAALRRLLRHESGLQRVRPLERAEAPSTSTVQAPHWPSPQPNLAALRPRSLRST